MKTAKKEKTRNKKTPAVTKAKAVRAVVKAAKAKPAALKKAVKKAPLQKKPSLLTRRQAVLKKKELAPALPKAEELKAAAAVLPQQKAKLKPSAQLPPAPVEIKPKAPLTLKEKEEHPPKKVLEKPLAPPPKAEPAAAAEAAAEIELKTPVALKDLAVKLKEKPSVLIKLLMDKGIMSNINQFLDEPTATLICQQYGYKIKQAPSREEEILKSHLGEDMPQQLKPRPPIVTLMGHVDHGKTSLLDAIRKSRVAELEHGGITQHIGAHRVKVAEGEITFLDTPGHEAFTAMRARGAKVTDLVVLVVAADDGVMPQTMEAIDHARAANVPIIVAINKIDKPQVNIDRVKKQLAELDLTPEDWSGKTITVPVSAKSGAGIDNLLEMILLEAQMLELKSNPQRIASGVVIEARLSKGRGPLATLLVQQGTLRLNQNIIVGSNYGRIRAMFDDRGQQVSEAPASFPVEVLGLSGVPLAGEQFFVVEDEKMMKELAESRQEAERKQQIRQVKRISLEDLYSQIKEGKIKELRLIIKADVQGSLEAIRDTLKKIEVSEIRLEIIHGAVGHINASDVVLAVASNALIIGFNVSADTKAREMISREGVEVKTYNIIYELANEIKAALEGMLEPKLKKVLLGKAEVRKVFRLSRAGTVAGCFVAKGKITRSAEASLIRNGVCLFEGKLSSLKRFKDDAREVAEGFECGISLLGFDQFLEGDVIEAFETEKIARKI